MRIHVPLLLTHPCTKRLNEVQMFEVVLLEEVFDLDDVGWNDALLRDRRDFLYLRPNRDETVFDLCVIVTTIGAYPYFWFVLG